MDELQTSNDKLQNNLQMGDFTKYQTKSKPRDLRERLLFFSRRILELCKSLPRIPECDGIRRQLANAATSIGANFEEADGALSKRDFINKTSISRKEAKETKYWLRIIRNTYVDEVAIDPDIKECEELVSILSAILIKVGAKQARD